MSQGAAVKRLELAMRIPPPERRQGKREPDEVDCAVLLQWSHLLTV
jgi:hypothetical protein